MKSMNALLAGLFLLCTYSLCAQYDPGINGPIHSIAEAASESSEHQTLMAAVRAAGLDQRLNSEGPYTVFAPSERAFKGLSGERLQSLLQPENLKELRALLNYHVIPGEFSAADILKALCRGSGVANLTTLQGNTLMLTMEGIDIVLTDCLGNSARITTADSVHRNGVVHVIDRVIAPR